MMSVSYIGFLRAEDLFCDAAFNCRDGRVLAHKFILGNLKGTIDFIQVTERRISPTSNCEEIVID